MTEHHACAANEPEPLRVRVARALRCKLSFHHQHKIWTCWCTDGAHATLAYAAPGTRYGLVAPYGEDSPAGWACTGPFFRLYRLSVDEWRGSLLVRSEIDGRAIVCAHLDRCRGAAEWVAEHGAAVIGMGREP